MTDRYAELVNSTVGRQIAGRLGLPRPAVLRRYKPGDPLLPGPALLGAAGPSTLPPLAPLLEAAGVDTRPGPDDRLAALILDASGVAGVDDLGGIRDFLAEPLRRLGPSGRVVVIGLSPEGGDVIGLSPEGGDVIGLSPEGGDVVVDSVRQALDGVTRSLAKELRRGATANLVLADDPASLESALRFLLSGRSAYVDGQPIRLGPGSAPDPDDWLRPLAGRTAVVTGAARGIGAAIAEVLARDGAHVVVADLPSAGEGLAEVANRIGGTALPLDVTAPDAAARLFTHLRERHGGVDVLVHNAGITRDRLLVNLKPDQWAAVLEVNLAAQLRITEALLAADVMGEGGRVVTLSSTTGFAGNRGQTNYAASKAGIIGMVRAFAPTFAARGWTINGVAPGLIDTDMIHSMPLATREVARRLNSLQQAGLPIDVAEAIAWLASPGAGGVTGQVLRVCGQNLVGA